MKFWISLFVLPLLVASCSDVADSEVQPSDKTISVSVGSGLALDIESRTSLAPDGTTVKWTTGDKIALWAVGGQGNTVLEACPFVLWHYNESYNAAKFTATIPVMPDDTYIYYAVSPTPIALDGTQATFDIPAVQDGSYLSDSDVMVATPVTGGALKEGDNSELVNLTFSHKVHILKINIPSNNLGEEVSELQINFPQPVAGRLTVDATRPDAAPVLANGTNQLILRFAEPLAIGTTVYAMIAPVDIPTTEAVTITAIGQTGESQPGIIAGRNFAAGHTTPIALHIPKMGRLFTRLTFALPADGGTSTLGEKVSNLTLTAPEGALFDNGSNVRAFTPDANGKYTLILKPSWRDNLSGKPVTVTYESASAIVSGAVTMPQITAYAANSVAFTVPYLLFEDFSKVETFSNNEEKKGVSDPDAIWIPGITGWSAARTGGSASKSVRIVGHREGAWSVGANYEARMDSPTLSGLKAGKSVSVKINYNFSGSTNKGTPYLKYGTSTAGGLISGATDAIESQVGELTLNDNRALDGSYDKVNYTHEYTATCTNASRFSWVAYGKDKTSGFNTVYFFYYVYFDNIKVSIAQ